MLTTARVRTSRAPCTTTAAQENEHELHDRRSSTHHIRHYRCGCAGWKRAWSSKVDHHRATAETCADDCFDRDPLEAFPAQIRICFNDEIAPARGRRGLRGFSERVRNACFARPQDVPGRESAQARSRTDRARVGGIEDWRAVTASRTSRHAVVLGACW